ncbi:hypothetical protein PHAVU_010G026500 [Phaseolus vulgaris]|uniref:Uncharacterized protein n=1 Tax=Phaseolus vulgaris TaxID=3885 RepID=V7APQ7_PHAVU|nr:hypothetical protein PHAVU_010G026500g [Phaseolus vulgaris]ESW06176.1 hypothetical protein PHAVU_010G026500g [Phaseolus vulgaris]
MKRTKKNKYIAHEKANTSKKSFQNHGVRMFLQYSLTEHVLLKPQWTVNPRIYFYQQRNNIHQVTNIFRSLDLFKKNS